ncbi:MAG: cytochrome b/b6 domain-containing protein [Alphaproteobacteria bacterium]
MLERTASSTFTEAEQFVGGRYDGLARLLHWVFAVGIIYASIVGYSLGWIADRPLHDFLSNLNTSLATVLILLFPLRVAWKFVRTNPPPPTIDAKQLKLARGVQNLLYLTIFEVLVSGFLMVPHGYMFFDLIQVPTLFEKGPMTELFSQAHRIGNAFLAGLVVLHVMGVIVNTMFRRVNILRRML